MSDGISTSSNTSESEGRVCDHDTQCEHKTLCKHKTDILKKWASFDRLTSNTPKVVFLGDSVLDTFYFLRNPARSLRKIMEEKLERHHTMLQPASSSDGETEEPTVPMTCLNLAIEKMTTYDFLDRGVENSWSKLQAKREEVYTFKGADPLDADGYNHLVGSDGRIRSALNLSLLKNVKHTFLCLGGNDIYLSRDMQFELATSLLPFCAYKRERVAENMKERYNHIIDEVLAAAPDTTLTLVVCYKPHNEFCISGLSGYFGTAGCEVQKRYLSWMVTPSVKNLLQIASERGLNVIDMSQTVDPNNELHYGNQVKSSPDWCGAESSDVSQVFLSTLLMEVLVAQASKTVTTPPSRCFWGNTSGTHYNSTHSVALNPLSINTYTFQEGFKVDATTVVSDVPRNEK